jgi:CRP-like cAMP-binding protein
MTSSPLACDACPVRDRAACAALEGPERVELARLGRHRALAPGEMLFAADEDNDRCATLVRGALKISTVESDGSERILSLIHPAGFVGELFAPLARFEVTALTQSEVCLFSRREYEAAVERYPPLGLALKGLNARQDGQTRAAMVVVAIPQNRMQAGSSRTRVVASPAGVRPVSVSIPTARKCAIPRARSRWSGFIVAHLAGTMAKAATKMKFTTIGSTRPSAAKPIHMTAR